MQRYRAGIDIGSTTVKLVLLDASGQILFGKYRRHQAHTQETLAELLSEARETVGECMLRIRITGSGSINLGKALGIEFVQEVVAVATALQQTAPQTDVAIELGGEDAKIIYFDSESFGHLKDLSCSGIGHCNPAILLWLLNLMDRTLYCLKNPYHKLHSFQSLASV